MVLYVFGHIVVYKRCYFGYGSFSHDVMKNVMFIWIRIFARIGENLYVMQKSFFLIFGYLCVCKRWHSVSIDKFRSWIFDYRCIREWFVKLSFALMENGYEL